MSYPLIGKRPVSVTPIWMALPWTMFSSFADVAEISPRKLLDFGRKTPKTVRAMPELL